jgi:hypothetical protein
MIPLVMTSGNISDEPIVAGNDEAIAALGEVADLFLLHNRDIARRIDDSVVEVMDLSGTPLPLGEGKPRSGAGEGSGRPSGDSKAFTRLACGGQPSRPLPRGEAYQKLRFNARPCVFLGTAPVRPPRIHRINRGGLTMNRYLAAAEVVAAIALWAGPARADGQ